MKKNVIESICLCIVCIKQLSYSISGSIYSLILVIILIIFSSSHIHTILLNVKSEASLYSSQNTLV